MKRMTMNERRQIFQAQQQAEREMRERLLAPIPTDGPAKPGGRRRTWVIVTLLVSVLLGGGLVIGDLVTFHVPTSVVDAVWPKL
jgi:hypothetical protein